MATITAATPTSYVAGAGIARRGSIRASSSPVLGLPVMAMKRQVKCSAEVKPSSGKTGPVGMGASLLAAASGAVMSNPALALVDERLSTEGTGLPFGLSNNLLGWILFGVFGLIWTLYFTYTSTLEEDEESGLSL